VGLPFRAPLAKSTGASDNVLIKSILSTEGEDDDDDVVQVGTSDKGKLGERDSILNRMIS
jgi:hypothetical protein